MVIATVKKSTSIFWQFYRARKLQLNIFLLVLIILFSYIKTQAMADLWLTRDQQGQVLFNLGYYRHAAATFNDPLWQAYSYYAAGNFDQAASIYSQFDLLEAKFFRANAMAHARHYVNAREVYQAILTENPNHQGAQENLRIVQAIINEINLTSQNQAVEQGESSKSLGDEPQTADGAKRQDIIPQEMTQLTAEQILQDPKLNEIWLRQVQKNPSRFLSYKFQQQLEQQAPSDKQGKDDNE